MGTLRPLLRWAGSKQRLLPTLVRLAPDKVHRYFEPFAGSASLFFALQPRRATLSDVNADLVNFYRCLKRNPVGVYSGLVSAPRTKLDYLHYRSAFGDASDPEERAILFWYLNRHCFNGLFRTSRFGRFNVPYGSKLPPLPTMAHVEQCVRVLRRASIRCEDFETVIAEAGRGDFVYVDPPYRRASVRDRGEYGIGAMADHELSRLITALKRADRRGAKVLISYNCDLTAYLPAWSHEVINGRYLISADPSKRISIKEFTVRNYGLNAQ